MRITIVSYTQEFSMELGVQEPVLDIKKRLEDYLGIPASSMALSICGFELLDGLDMDDYPIVTNNTRIDLTLNSNFTALFYPVSKFYILVKFFSKHITVEVESNETVRSLKEKIQSIGGTPVKRMQLYFSGVELGDDFRNLYEYGIQELSEIIVYLKAMNRIKAHVPVKRLFFAVQTSSSLYSGVIIPMEMKDSCTVEEMKGELCGNKIIPQDDYIFIHKQRIMRETCSLRWHGVGDGETLYVFKGTVSR